MSPHIRLSALAFLLLLALPAPAATPEFHVNLQYDHVDIDDAPGFGAVDDWRRQRVFLGWKATDWLEFKFEHDFVSEQWTDAHLRIRSPAGSFFAGQFKQPFGMETMTSNKSRLLMESAYNSVFGIDRRLGVGWQWDAPTWSVATGLYGQDLGGGNSGEGVVARGVWTPVKSEGTLVHLGLGVGRERRDNRTISLSTRPEASLTSLRLARTGTILDADDIDRVGIEGAWQRGPLLLQAEAGRMDIGRLGGPDVEATGAYLMAAWMFTGEVHPYKGGTFAAPKPDRNWGAFEAVARVARIDFDHGLSATDGHDSITLGVNWYLTDRVRLMANYVEAEQRGSAPTLLDPRVLEFRVQLGF